MKQAEDNRTLELPGVSRAKRGRPAIGDRAMTAAERQKAYRDRQRDTRYETRPEEMSRVTLIDQLGSALRAIDDGHELSDGAEWIAEGIIREIITRYELNQKRLKSSRVTKSGKPD